MLSSAKKAGPASTPVIDGPNGRWSLPAPSVRRLAWRAPRRRLVPYMLLLPSTVAIGLMLVWPAIQLAVYSFQDYGLPQITGAAPTQWAGFGNFHQILADSEFWSALRISVVFAA